jgi:ribosomal protein S18 acetylase RimI-like enzyme
MNTPALTYRDTLTQDDVEAIHVMVAESGVFSAEEIDVAVELAEDRLSHKELSDYHFMLAESDGTVVGYSCYGRIPLTQGRYDLYWIVVDGNAQQRGVATELFRQTEEAIGKLNGKIVYAETSSRTIYAPAQAFYVKAGFELLCRISDFYADGDDKLIYGKQLLSK